MSTIYQPIVIEKSNEIIESLVDLFDDYEIMSLEFTRKYCPSFWHGNNCYDGWIQSSKTVNHNLDLCSG